MLGRIWANVRFRHLLKLKINLHGFIFLIIEHFFPENEEIKGNLLG